MFGTNPLRPQELLADGSVAITEIFLTIQGEGPHAGKPAVFARLQGCNLRCYFCDTQFETMLGGAPMTMEAAATAICFAANANTKLVVLTGGEPMRQNIVPLVTALTDFGFHVQIETAGTLWVPGLAKAIDDGHCDIVVSPKTGKVHPQVAMRARAWKYIVSADACNADGLPSFSTQVRGRVQVLARPPLVSGVGVPEVFVQPMDEYDIGKNKANTKLAVDLCMRHGYRLSIQTHKVAGIP